MFPSTNQFADFLCLFDCFEPHVQFLSYLAAVTITSDKAANLDLYA
jgi:hypothetical protein